MLMEPIETRLARLEEGMVSVKGDTSHIRKSFESFQQRYWVHLLEQTGKVAGVSAITSSIMAVAIVMIARALSK